MSRTTRRGKPSRQFRKYINLDVIYHENRNYHSRWGIGEFNGLLLWKDDRDDQKTYEEYAALKIRKYHMDFRPWNKTPGYCHRIEVERQTRLHKAALHHAIRNGTEDELILVRLQQDAEWMWS